jgi:hypothetical protein
VHHPVEQLRGVQGVLARLAEEVEEGPVPGQ